MPQSYLSILNATTFVKMGIYIYIYIYIFISRKSKTTKGWAKKFSCLENLSVHGKFSSVDISNKNRVKTFFLLPRNFV